MKYETFLPSPLGLIKAVYSETCLEQIDFADQVDELTVASGAAGSRLMAQLQDELAAYFAGTLRTFSVTCSLERGTGFQQRVWQALQNIPYGTTVTYGDLAKSLGLSAGASRAVGKACGANPIPILIPCHRVIAAGGSLGGYSGGLWRKARLLALEGAGSYSYPL